MIAWLLILGSLVAVQDCTFIDYPWEWTQDAGYRTQIAHLPRCITGPAGCYDHVGCIGRFDMDGDCDVDLYDVALYDVWCAETDRQSTVGVDDRLADF